MMALVILQNVGPAFLEAFVHPEIAIGTERCDNFLSILLAEQDLMVPREAI
jgi:hypothetical protein